jgi:serine/threonine protein phosphatase 1
MDEASTPAPGAADSQPVLAGPDTADAQIEHGDLDPAVAPYHLRLDPDAYDGIYVIGDVHGCLAELEALLEDIDPGPHDLLLFVGDLVRKGPDSGGVVAYVRQLPNAYSVRGNNEDKLIDGRKTLDALADSEIDGYLASLPVVISFGDAMVVHGGVDPGRDLADHGLQDLLTFRAVPPGNGYDGPFWWETYDGPTTVLFGHTVLEAPVVTELAGVLDLQLADNRRAWEMGPDGSYRQHRPDGTTVDTHAVLMDRATRGAAVGDATGFEDVPVDVRGTLED